MNKNHRNLLWIDFLFTWYFSISQLCPSFCWIVHIQTRVSFVAKSKIKCFVHEFHDNFRFCGIVNTNIEQLFNYFMRNRNMQSHFFTFIGHLYISLQFSFILRWTLSQTRHHSTALLFTGELQVEQRYVWITVFLSILTTFAFTFFWKVEALS